jgi:hypothetical protein
MSRGGHRYSRRPGLPAQPPSSRALASRASALAALASSLLRIWPTSRWRIWRSPHSAAFIASTASKAQRRA